MASQPPVDTATTEKQQQQQYNQPQQYQQYQQPGYPMTPVYAPEREVNRGWEMAKRVLHGLVILFSIVGIATAAALLAKTNVLKVDYYDEDSGLVETITSCTAIPVLAIAAIWSAAELITQLCRKWKSGIHPGAHVGMSLILWLAAIICTALYGSIFTWSDSWDYDYEYCERYNRNSYYSYARDCPSDSERSTQRNLSIVTLVFLAIVGILSFVLFVGACVDTNKRNRDRAYTYAMARQPTIPVGWRLVPDQQQQYPHPPQQAHMQSPVHSSVHSPVASPAVPDQNRGTVNEYYTPGSAQ